MLVTSRSALRVRGEHILPVLPLELPAANDDHTPEELAAAPAVRFFEDRAQATSPGFSFTPAQAPIAAEICRRLDGLPLAIELAAARSYYLTLPDLLSRLDRRLPLLTSSVRDLPERQQTMRDAIAWSHDLLAPAEKVLFRRLSVFVGGFAFAAAEALAAVPLETSTDDHPPTGDRVLDQLASLVDKNLVRYEADATGGPRYGLLETIREYAQEQLVAAGEERLVGELHAQWMLSFAEAHEVYYNDPRREPHMTLLEAEWPNLQAAFAWFEAAAEPINLLRTAVALYQFSYLRGHSATVSAWLERVLSLAESPPAILHGKAMSGLAYLSQYHADAAPKADDYAKAGLAILRPLGVPADLHIALITAGMIASLVGDHARAEAHYAQALSVAAEISDPVRAATATADALKPLGEVAHSQGRPDRATELLEQALALYREVGDTWGVVATLQYLGTLASDTGALDQAVSRYKACLVGDWSGGELPATAAALGGIACAAADWGQTTIAVRLASAAQVTLEPAGFAVIWPTNRNAVDRCLDVARSQLGAEAYAAAWADGRHAAQEQVAGWVAEVSPPSAPEISLSPREREIVALMVEDRTHRAIGETLFISERTVDSHVARIFRKLGVRTRADAVAAARACGLIDPPSTGPAEPTQHALPSNPPVHDALVGPAEQKVLGT